MTEQKLLFNHEILPRSRPNHYIYDTQLQKPSFPETLWVVSYSLVGIRQLVSILGEDDLIVVVAACDVLSFLAKHSNVRMVANKMNIVEKLVKYSCLTKTWDL